jgi:2-haloacid dehalogenase
VFDAYGTLFDVASATARCQDVLRDKASALGLLWREKQLQYTWLRAVQGRHADFWQVTGDALDYAMDALELGGEDLRKQLMALYLRLNVFTEVPNVLQHLKQSGMSEAILSNGSPSMLAAAVEHAGIGAYLDLIISVEEVGVYKPHPSVYRRAAERLNLAPRQICFLSSNAWDAYAASAFGMQVIWCNRYGQRAERLPGMPDAEIRDLAQVPALLSGQ